MEHDHPLKFVCIITKSVSCISFTPSDITFIQHVLGLSGGWNFKWRYIDNPKGADWIIRLETQKYIDTISDIQGHSATFPLLTPKLTFISRDDWTTLPYPISVFQSIYIYRRYLIMLECGRAFKLESTIFRPLDKISVNNRLIANLVGSQWLYKGDALD